jgi:cytochrome c oxidase cbb3-type subunit 2
MNIAPFIFIGLLATFSASWFGFVFRSQADIGRQTQFTNQITGLVYPIPRDGEAAQGAEVYRAQGCASCHTQQVRAESEGPDIPRGWGIRRTVLEDFMLERPAQLGSVRIGPDLANVGLRITTNDVMRQYKHLINPRSIQGAEKSMMPQYKYLFEKRKAVGTPGAIVLDDDREHEYIPKDEAKQLVAYLLSLKSTGDVFEAPRPMPKTSTNAPAGDTNAPAGATNAAAPAQPTNAASAK